MLVDITDVPLDRKSIDHEGERQHDTHVDKCHPEIAREEPPGNEAEQHHDPGENKVFNDVAHHDRECQEFVKKEVHDRDYQCESEERQNE